MIETISIKWDLLGAKLAGLSDNEQSQFFHGFAKELGGPTYESHLKREMQMCFINNKLDDKDKSVLETYFPALWCK